MPSLAEDGEGHSRNNSRASSYGNVPDSPQDLSLIQGDESLDNTNNRSSRHLLPPNSTNSPLRGSFDTTNSRESEESSSSLLQHAGDDPRGEAPPYFEVVDLDNNGGRRQQMGGSAAENATEASSYAPQSATVGSRRSHDPETQENRHSRRLSGFRGLLHTLTNTNTRSPVPPIPQEPPQRSSGHIRDASGASVTSASTHDSRILNARERATSRASHRPSTSGSGSGLNSVFRTVSRQRSQTTLHSAHFNSPSMISLNSISAPLTHTLTRTEVRPYLFRISAAVLIDCVDKLPSLWTYG
jgi:hypothetical protein